MKRLHEANTSKVPAAAWAEIKLLALDVDGVLTDGSLFISSNGTETKQFSVLDGMGMVRLRHAGVIVAWISGRPSGATTLRAEELKIPHVIQGRSDKLEALQELAASLGFTSRQCCYMGDDDIDAPAIAWAGVGVTVQQAMPAALQAAIYVPQRPAGRGAVREVCDHILAAHTARKAKP
ncbi:MAG: HAD-IIIA family hydrolase [Opitutaceae bacterium]